MFLTSFALSVTPSPNGSFVHSGPQPSFIKYKNLELNHDLSNMDAFKLLSFWLSLLLCPYVTAREEGRDRDGLSCTAKWEKCEDTSECCQLGVKTECETYLWGGDKICVPSSFNEVYEDSQLGGCKKGGNRCKHANECCQPEEGEGSTKVKCVKPFWCTAFNCGSKNRICYHF